MGCYCPMREREESSSLPLHRIASLLVKAPTADFSKLHNTWFCSVVWISFILNRVFTAAAREARKIVEDGIATAEDVDKAIITCPSQIFESVFYS